MGAATGGGGGDGTDASRPVKNSGGCPPEITIFMDFFSEKSLKFQILQYFQNKVGQIRGEIRIMGVGGFDSKESVSSPPPTHTHTRNFVAAPLYLPLLG